MSKPSASTLSLIVAVAVLAFLHFALRPVLGGWFARPNLLLCALLITSLRVRPGAAAGAGFLLGLLEDAVSVTHFGGAALSFTILGFLGARIRELFIGEEPLFMGTYLFLGTWLYQLVGALLFGTQGSVLSYVFVRSPLDAAATAFVGYLVLPLVRPR